MIPASVAGNALSHQSRIGHPGVVMATTSHEAKGHGGGQTCDAAKGANNSWIRTGCHWNLNLTTLNKRTLYSQASLEVVFKELEGIRWDAIGLTEATKTVEAVTVLKNGRVFSYRGLVDRRELAVRLPINKRLAGNIDEHHSIRERASGLVIRPNKRYKFKVVQGYAPTSSHEDQLVELLYEYVESAMANVKTQYTVMGDLIAKVGKKQAGYNAVGNYGLGCMNRRGDLLVELAERNNRSMMNTFSRKRESPRVESEWGA